MAIIAAFITASVALLVPFIAFYLNKTQTMPRADGAGGVVEVPVSVSPSARLFVVVVMALVFSVPIGLLSFCVAVVVNLFLAPQGQDSLLFSLDAGLNGGAIFALSLVWHAGFNEPRQWWLRFRWYQVVASAFFGSLGYIMAFVGNAIWALALGQTLEQVHVFQDSFDAAVAGAVVGWLAGYATVKVEELRESAPQVS